MCYTYDKSKGGDARELQSRMVPPPPKKKKTGSSHLKTMYFQAKMQKFVGKWLKRDSLSIFKSEFESLF